MAGNKPKILFLCTGNSCRSQMAEGWTRALQGDWFEAWSAGIEAHGLNPRAVKIMAEAGVDISAHRSKTVAELPTLDFDFVVTVCDHAHESCPLFPGKAKIVHAGFDDPPRLAQGARSEEEALAHYRRVRDEIRDYIGRLRDRLSRDGTRTKAAIKMELAPTGLAGHGSTSARPPVSIQQGASHERGRASADQPL